MGNITKEAMPSPRRNNERASRRHRTIPDNFRIWIGRCGVDGWETAFWRHAGTVGLSPDVRPEPELKNIQSVTFGIGELFVSAFHTTVENLPLTFSLERGGLMTSLLPFGSPIDWPLTKTLTQLRSFLHRSRPGPPISQRRGAVDALSTDRPGGQGAAMRVLDPALIHYN